MSLPRPGGAPAGPSGGYGADPRRADDPYAQQPRTAAAPTQDYGGSSGYGQPVGVPAAAYAPQQASVPVAGGGYTPHATAGNNVVGAMPSGAYGAPPHQLGGTDWNNWAPAGMNEQMLQAGGAMARNILASNVGRYQPGMWGFWRALKYYFAVDNAYVLRKLQTLLFPLVKRDWVRRESSAAPPSAPGAPDDPKEPRYLRPSLDINAPDLYIPAMAFVTYVLITGFVKGARGTFTPSALTEATSSCVVTQLLEVLVFHLGLYLLGAPAATLDLIAYTGYKYVALVANMATGLAFGLTGYYLAFAWTASMACYFMLKTMADAVPAGGGSTRDFTIFGLAALQALVIWWLGYTRELSGSAKGVVGA